MVLVIVGLLSLLCMLHSYLSCSNQLLYPNNKLSMSLPLNLCANHTVNGNHQLLPKDKLSWKGIYTGANLKSQSKFNLQ